MTNNETLDARLLACANFVRSGSTVYDVGSDHAYLPIYLIKRNIASFAVAADINEGPIKRADLNIRLSNLSSKIKTELSNGLEDVRKYEPDDIVIAGMGGELIRNIISASDYVKDPKIRLILQPMTMPEVVRKYLADTGFNIIDETICYAAEKYYQVICAEYNGCKSSLTPRELLLGKINIDRIQKSPTSDDIGYIKQNISSVKRRLDGRRSSKVPDTALIDADVSLLGFLNELLLG